MASAVELRDAGSKGRGVFALRSFARGDIIFEFTPGRLVSEGEIATLTPWEREHLGELTISTCQILPAPRCYLNHACSPNAISSSDIVRAWRNIQAGDEVTIDCRLNSLDDWEMHCACTTFGGPHIVIGSFLSLPAAAQRCYSPYAPPFVQCAYTQRSGLPRSAAVGAPFPPEWPVRW
jgi:hypothetical protein